MIRQEAVSTPRGRFATLEAGPVDGPLALVLHGFPDVPRSFTPTLQALASAGYRAVAPWMRGYDPSPTEGPYDPDSTGTDAVALADALSPTRPVVLVGHDWGAVAGYTAVAECPGRFHCFVALSVPHPIAFLRNLVRYPRQLWRSAYMGVLAAPALGERAMKAGDFRAIELAWGSGGQRFAPPAQLLEEIKATISRSMPAPIRYYRSVFWPPFSAGLRINDARGKKIPVPTRFIGGRWDVIRPQLGEGQERFFEGPFDQEVIASGHFMHVERPADVNARILEWAERHAKR